MIYLALAAWVGLLTVAMCGWGILFAKVTGIARGTAGNGEKLSLHYSFLLGVFLVTLLALGANFFYPLTTRPGVVVLALGLVFVMCFKRALPAQIDAFALLVASTFWVVCGMPYDGLASDAGLYHLQFEQWIAHDRLLWGLANLEPRFGFDSMWLMLVSTIRMNLSGWLPEWTHAVVADMAMRVFVFWWLLGLFVRALSSRDWFGTWFVALNFVLLTQYLWRMRSAGTDVPANLLAVAMWLLLYECWVVGKKTLTQSNAAICSAALLVTWKLSILPMVLLIVPVLYWARRQWRELGAVGLIAAVYIGAWLLRNFVLTGCLVYPVASTCFDVSWGLGQEQAESMKWAVTSFARQHLGPNVQVALPDELLTHFNIEWLVIWLKSFPRTYYFHFLAGSALLGLLLAYVRRGQESLSKERVRFLTYSAVVAAFGLLYWLVLGPDPRFSWSVFFILSIVCVGLGLRSLPSGASKVGFGNKAVIYSCAAITLSSLLLGLTRHDPVNFEKYRSYGYDGEPYEWSSLEYRGVVLFKSNADCGDRYPCINHDNVKSLDKLFDANSQLHLD